MTKLRHSDFDGEATPVKTRAQRLAAWRKANGFRYDLAKMAKCVCVPTRAQLLLIAQYDGNGPPWLNA